MKADIGSLLFIEDKHDNNKKRPHICIHVFTNKAGVPYNWLILPITSNNTVGENNLIEVKHRKLNSISFAKINNIKTIPWSDDIEVARMGFAKKYVAAIVEKINCCLTDTNN